MSDFGNPVVDPAGYNPTQKLSQLLQVKSQQQALQGQAAEVQVAQQTARQKANIASYFQQKAPTIGADGTVDVDANFADPDLRKAAGDQFPEVMQHLLQVKSAQLGAKQQLVNLNDSTRTQFQGIVGGLRTDPDVVKDTPEGRAKVKEAMGQFAASGPDAARIANIYGPVIENTPQGRLGLAVSSAQLQAMDASAQAGRQAPSYASTGDRLTNTNPQAAPTPDIGVGAAPGFVMDPVTHNWVPTPAIRGGGAQPSAAPPSAPPSAAPAPGTAPSAPAAKGGLPHYAPGEADTLKANTDAGGVRYNQLVNAAAESPARANVLDNIIRLAPQIRTGPGSSFKAAANTALGQIPGFSGAANDAAAYNEATKFLHQNALRSWQAAGGTGTDSQLHTIEGANPNAEVQDPKTIVALAKFAKAGELALQAKATAHQTWLHQPGNNFANQSDFEGQWRQNFDPVLFQLKTATPEEARKLVDGLPQSEKNALGRKQAWLKSEGVY